MGAVGTTGLIRGGEAGGGDGLNETTGLKEGITSAGLEFKRVRSNCLRWDIFALTAVSEREVHDILQAPEVEISELRWRVGKDEGYPANQSVHTSLLLM